MQDEARMLAELQEILTLSATAAGIYVAVGGLNAWRRETTGKRDIELCQAVIEKFYEAEHKMQVLRSPMSYSNEGESRTKEDNETTEETARRNLLFVPLARYNQQFEFWAELMSYRFRMRALFGDKASDAFKPIDDAVRSFRAAASVRYRALYSDPNGLSADSAMDFEKTIWAVGSADNITKQMEEGIRLMEAICVPIVRATRPSSERLREWWKGLKLF